MPTTFVFLDQADVESLYSQLEPELIRASVIEEAGEEVTARGQIGFKEYLQTEAGLQTLQKKLTEYKRIDKSPSRKLRDVVAFLYEKKGLKTFSSFRPASKELQEFDDAVKLLVDRYDVAVDNADLTAKRDKLFGLELSTLERQLSEVRGQILVDGVWKVEVRPDVCVFSRPFVSNVTDSPICEVRVDKTTLGSSHRKAIEGAKLEGLRLVVIGTVITSVTPSSKIVRVRPIGIY